MDCCPPQLNPRSKKWVGRVFDPPAPVRDPGSHCLISKLKENYSIWTRPPSGAGAGRCGARQASSTDTWCTQETVQCGAQDFSVRYSRRISSIVYFSSGIAG